MRDEEVCGFYETRVAHRKDATALRLHGIHTHTNTHTHTHTHAHERHTKAQNTQTRKLKAQTHTHTHTHTRTNTNTHTHTTRVHPYPLRPLTPNSRTLYSQHRHAVMHDALKHVRTQAITNQAALAQIVDTHTLKQTHTTHNPSTSTCTHTHALTHAPTHPLTPTPTLTHTHTPVCHRHHEVWVGRVECQVPHIG